MTIETKNRKTLADIALDNGVFAIIAMDQRNTLKGMFKAVDIDASEEDLRTAKADVARALTPAASGILLDPTYGVPAVTEAHALAPSCGLLVAAEPSSRNSYNGEPRTHRDPGTQRELGRGAGRGCREVSGAAARGSVRPRRQASPIWYVRCWMSAARSSPIAHPQACPPLSRILSTSSRRTALRQAARGRNHRAARALDELDIDLLKLEYPGSPEACRRLADVCTAPGLCYRPESPSSSSVTSSRSHSTKVEPLGSSPADQSGGRPFRLTAWNVNASWTASLVLAWTTLWRWPTIAPARGPTPRDNALMTLDTVCGHPSAPTCRIVAIEASSAYQIGVVP